MPLLQALVLMSCFMPCHKNSQSEYRKAFVHSRVSQPTFPSCTALRVLATVLPKAWYKRVMLHFRVVHHIISHLSLVYRDNTRDSSMAYHSKALHSYNHLQSWTNTPLGQFLDFKFSQRDNSLHYVSVPRTFVHDCIVWYTLWNESRFQFKVWNVSENFTHQTINIRVPRTTKVNFQEALIYLSSVNSFLHHCRIDRLFTSRGPDILRPFSETSSRSSADRFSPSWVEKV